MANEIVEWRIYQCAHCKQLEIGGLLGHLENGDPNCPNCDAKCTNLTVVDNYKITLKP